MLSFLDKRLDLNILQSYRLARCFIRFDHLEKWRTCLHSLHSLAQTLEKVWENLKVDVSQVLSNSPKILERLHQPR